MANQFAPGTSAEPTSTVEISISCRNLLDMDLFSRSDPMVVCYHHPLGCAHWVELMRTEIVWDCLNPDFATKIIMDYRFEEEQPLRFEIYDIDSPNESLESQDFLGHATCNLAQVVSAGTADGLTLSLQQNKSKYYPILPKKGKHSQNGTILLLAEELPQLKEMLTVKLQGFNMGRPLCCIFQPKAFYVLSKVNESGNYIVVYRSEEARGINPIWQSTKIPMRSLGDKDRQLKLQVWQVGINGYNKSLGFLYTTTNKMQSFIGKDGVKLVGKNGLEKDCSLKFVQVMIAPIYSFLDYISGGTQIHCCFAIDFTASNGTDPSDMNSLHHFSTANNLNPYEQAIKAVGEIIQEYDQTKRFPVWGFGAKIPPESQISHNFPVTLSESPYCDGIEGVLEAYRNCILKINLHGPTNFAPVIRDVAKEAREHMDGKHYYVLLIITDGIITDMPQTKEVIVEASKLPLSIIIAGVGRANFAAMQELDGDTVRLSYGGVVASRDIVQFVPYRDAHTWMATVMPEAAAKWSSSCSFESTSRLAKVKLAQEVLAEIPDQITSFMKSKGIIPGGFPNCSSNNNVKSTTT